jgi:hypothetical protein
MAFFLIQVADDRADAMTVALAVGNAYPNVNIDAAKIASENTAKVRREDKA